MLTLNFAIRITIHMRTKCGKDAIKRAIEFLK